MFVFYFSLLICLKGPTKSTKFDVGRVILCAFAALMMSIKLNEHGLIQQVLETVRPSDGKYSQGVHHCLHSGIYYISV
jgi:hypothetical protein